MQEIMELVLLSGRTALDLAIYVLLPIMVVMMAIMRVLDQKGVVTLVAKIITPLLSRFGVPGIGVFAMIQILLVGFAAPIATLALMEADKTALRKIAATFAMVMAMSQANAVFPLVTVGLDLSMTILTSIIGGLIAAAVTFYLTGRSLDIAGAGPAADEVPHPDRDQTILDLLISGGKQGMVIVYNSVPILVLAILAVAGLKYLGVIPVIESWLTPYLTKLGLPAVVILPLVTKFMAGGTAMMGVTMDLVQQGKMTALELNRVAGLMINPLDLVGVTLYMTAGPKTAAVVRPVIAGAGVAVVIRGVIHLILY